MTEKQNISEDTKSLTVGQMLKQERETLGLSRADIAKKLNLRTTLIDEIEHDEFSGIAAPTYIRGYLLNYANYVGIESEQLYQVLDKQVSLPDVQLQSFSRKTTRQARDHRWWIVTYCLFGSLLLMLVLWWVQDRNQPEHSDFSEKTVEELIVEKEHNAQLKIDDAMLHQSTTEQQEPSLAHIVVQVDKPCWLEVKDAHGQFLLEGLQNAPAQFELQGLPPFSVVMGAPENVKIYYENKSFDLSGFLAGKVARFQIPSASNK
tara:strand:+ start:985 stop:1770 length:786 start_codon:yes stop_codon:yes gene_type:complete